MMTTSAVTSLVTSLVWFRSDLRHHDNPALWHACKHHHAGNKVIGLYFICRKQWRQQGLGERRIQLMINAAAKLQQALAAHGIPLMVIDSDTFKACEKALLPLLQQNGISQLYFNLEYEVNERKRDIRICRQLQQAGISVYKYHDQCLVPPGEVVNRQGAMFKVFSPFKKQWLQDFEQYCFAPLGSPFSNTTDSQVPNNGQKDNSAEHKLTLNKKPLKNIDLSRLIKEDALWPVDETHAHQQLQDFLDQHGSEYHQQRDFPALNRTSCLSYLLALGVLSLRQCFYSAWQMNQHRLDLNSKSPDNKSPDNQGLNSWINELIWREFYRHLLVAFPDLCKHKAFKPETEAVPWRTNKADFQRWCEGKTGYPLVDAAMQQLNQSGWMHNRLRMVTAMFLTKHLLIDWRWGEAYFSTHLIDADLASNNGGWQWSASTGADGAPYFRIFNPVSQSQKFDAEGEFISLYLPQLSTLKAADRHFPTPEQRQQLGYSQPLVEHKFARQRALDAFALSKSSDKEKISEGAEP